MAWTTPRTWVAGEVVTAAYMNANVRDNTNHLYGSTWTTFSPTMTQSGSVALTTATGRYHYVGYRCTLHIFLDPSGTGTIANDIVIGNIPAAIAPRVSGEISAGNQEGALGNGYYFDSGTGGYTGICFFASSSTLKMKQANQTANVGTAPSIAVAAADSMHLDITYETSAAST